MTTARFGLLLCLVVLGSCDMTTNAERVVEDRKSTREFYLTCVDTVTRNAYGKSTIDSMQECRQAAVQIK
jgi:hypothetical protein